MFDGKTFGEEVVAVIKSYLDAEIAKIRTDLGLLSKRIEDIPIIDAAGIKEEMKSFTVSHVGTELYELRPKIMSEKDINQLITLSMPRVPELDVDDLIKQIELPKLPDIPSMVKESVDLAIASLDIKNGEPGKDGADGKNGADGKDGLDGKSVDLDQLVDHVNRFISDEVTRAVSALPTPKHGKDGTSVTLEDVRPMVVKEIETATARLEEAVKAIPRGVDGERGPEGPAGKDGLNGKDGVDGISLASAMIDRSGELVVTLSNGTQKNLGPIVGKDGSPGKDGTPGRDGIPGTDGVDGIGFDDMSAEVRDGVLYLMWSKGDVIKEAAVPGLRYRGVWKEAEYRMGDNVTWGGCTWIAMKDTPQGKPAESRDWSLAVKKGRDAGSPVKLERNDGHK